MELSLEKLNQNEKLQYWYEEVLEKEKNGMSVSDWCTNRPYAVSTYYKHQKLVKDANDAKLKER